MPLDALWGRLAGELLERLDAAATWTERFAVLERVMLRALSARVEIPSGARPEATEAFRRLAAVDGRLGVAELAADLGWSRRHLTEQFSVEYGVGPKELARVLRFERSKRLLPPPTAARWPRSPPSAGTPTRPTWPGTGGRSPAPARRGGWPTNSSQSSKPTPTLRRRMIGP